jgi:hypothetical protein
MLMPTYGNGDLCSRLLYNALNRAYLQGVASYYSYPAKGERPPYIPKDDGYIRSYPPLGDTLREVYDEASSNSNNHWGISDHDGHTREIQSVGC